MTNCKYSHQQKNPKRGGGCEKGIAQLSQTHHQGPEPHIKLTAYYNTYTRVTTLPVFCSPRACAHQVGGLPFLDSGSTSQTSGFSISYQRNYQINIQCSVRKCWISHVTPLRGTSNSEKRSSHQLPVSSYQFDHYCTTTLGNCEIDQNHNSAIRKTKHYRFVSV